MLRGVWLVFVLVVGACAAPAVSTPEPSTPVPSTTSLATSTPAPTPASTPAPSSAPTTAPEPEPSAFSEALALAPTSASLVSFNDWAQIKESLGASDVTSESPEEDRLRVLIDGLVQREDTPVSELEHVVGGYGLQSAMVHAENWDFDVLDYDWDTTITWDGPPISIVNLRDDLDMAPVLAHFDERDYASEEVDGATLRTHELDPSADWLTGELAILNVGILEDGRTLVMSSSDEAVRDFLAAERGVPSPAQAAADALEGPSAAHLIIGAEQICSFVDGVIAGADDPEIVELVDSAGDLSPWDALAIGYSKKLDPIGRIAFGYADPASAEADLDGRRLLAEEGPSLVRPEPLSEVQFTVDDAFSTDGVVELDVTPHEGWARNMLQAILQRDLIYAAC